MFRGVAGSFECRVPCLCLQASVYSLVGALYMNGTFAYAEKIISANGGGIGHDKGPWAVIGS
jgi:hypothetical protein